MMGEQKRGMPDFFYYLKCKADMVILILELLAKLEPIES